MQTSMTNHLIKASDVCEFFVSDHDFNGAVPEYVDIKIRLLGWYKIKNLNQYYMLKRGLMCNQLKTDKSAQERDKKKMLKAAQETMKEVLDDKPYMLSFDLHGYDFGIPYETDDQGEIVGDWPIIGELKVEADELVFAKEVPVEWKDKFELFRPYMGRWQRGGT